MADIASVCGPIFVHDRAGRADYSGAMHRPLLAPVAASLAAALLMGVPLAAQAPAPAAAPAQVDADTAASLRCAAAFAIVASEQRRGLPTALGFPPLAERGREYFVRVGARAMDRTKLSREAVRGLLEAEVAKLQDEAKGSADPEAAVMNVMNPCLERLEKEVPPLPKPTLGQCAAILSLAYDEIYAKEGLSSAARDLKILANVLDSRERKALEAQGITGNRADQRVAETHDKMLKEALETTSGVERYDLQTCYDLAQPDENSHY